MKSVKQLMDLTGRTALVTGGAGYIGKAYCDTLAEVGANVAVLDLDEKQVKDVAADIAAKHGVSTFGLAVDLADEEAVVAAPQKVADQLGGLDIIVNCAAFVGTSELKGWCVPFAEQSVKTWRAVQEVNLTAPFALVQAAVPLLRKSGHGSVIHLASIYAVSGPDLSLYDGTEMGNPVAYAASKGGIVQMTRWMSTVLAPEIRVNCISPGGIFRDQDPTFVERYEKRTPLKRMGTEEDMKGTLLWLASDLSSYVTGQNILVDGGWTVW